MGDLEKALSIFEGKFGKIGNLKFLLADGMEIDDVAADFLAIAQEIEADALMHDSYPEPELIG